MELSYNKIFICILIMIFIVISIGLSLTFHFIIGQPTNCIPLWNIIKVPACITPAKWSYNECVDKFDPETCDLLIPPLKYQAITFDNNGQIKQDIVPHPECIDFNDGHLAIIDRGCKNNAETISWFIQKGYHLDAVTPTTGNGEWAVVYMSR